MTLLACPMKDGLPCVVAECRCGCCMSTMDLGDAVVCGDGMPFDMDGNTPCPCFEEGEDGWRSAPSTGRGTPPDLQIRAVRLRRQTGGPALSGHRTH